MKDDRNRWTDDPRLVVLVAVAALPLSVLVLGALALSVRFVLRFAGIL